MNTLRSVLINIIILLYIKNINTYLQSKEEIVDTAKRNEILSYLDLLQKMNYEDKDFMLRAKNMETSKLREVRFYFIGNMA